MGCIQDKVQSQVVMYSPTIGNSLSMLTGNNIQNDQVVVMGVTQEGEERIFAFDAFQEKFRALVIPKGMQIWNYSSLVHITNREIMVTGGLNLNVSQITSQAYIYNSMEGTSIRLPDMITQRYTHISTFWRGKLYVIGGRDFGDDDEAAILGQCERFNFATHKWQNIAKMNVPRCTGFSFIYKDSIYVCGGLTGNMKRSRTIERYDESSDVWILMDFKLARGMECGILLSAAHFLSPYVAKDKLVIFGGNTEQGSQNTCLIYNIAERTVISGPPMIHSRVLQKSICFNNKIFVFGGSETDGIEIFNSQTNIWKEDTLNTFAVFVKPEDIDLFSASQPPITIPDIDPKYPSMTNSKSGVNDTLKNQVESHGLELSKQGDLRKKSEHPYVELKESEELSQITKSMIKSDLVIEKAYLFGCDLDQFILEIDFLNIRVERRSVPLQMRLFAHQGVVRMRDTILLMGGSQDSMMKSVKFTYSFDPSTFTAKRLDNMITPAYAFATLWDFPHVYVIGGKQTKMQTEKESEEKPSSEDSTHIQAILSACQRFDCQTNKWEKLPDLNTKRVSGMAFTFKGKIYIFGGFSGETLNKRPTSIEVLDPKKLENGWHILSVQFPIGIEGGSLLHVSSSSTLPDVLLFGGRISTGLTNSISKLSLQFKTSDRIQNEYTINHEIQKDDNEDEGNTKNNKDEKEVKVRDEDEVQEKEEDDGCFELKLNNVSSMLQSRSLHKIVQPYKQYILVLGGDKEPFVECVNLGLNYVSRLQTNVPHIDLMVQKLSLAIKQTQNTSLRQYSLVT